MNSRYLLIIAPVLAFTAACATNPSEGEKTQSTSQALCTATEFCDSTSSTATVSGGSTTTTKGSYADPGTTSPDKVEAGDNSLSCDCAHFGPNGFPLSLMAHEGSKGETYYTCHEIPPECCRSTASAKQTQQSPDDPPNPTVDPGDGTSCGPSSYSSAYNPCTYAWNGPYQHCNSSGYCFCANW